MWWVFNNRKILFTLGLKLSQNKVLVKSLQYTYRFPNYGIYGLLISINYINNFILFLVVTCDLYK